MHMHEVIGTAVDPATAPDAYGFEFTVFLLIQIAAVVSVFDGIASTGLYYGKCPAVGTVVGCSTWPL